MRRASLTSITFAAAACSFAAAASANVPPTAQPDSATTVKGKAISIAVLANDTDPDGDLLKLRAITAKPANGKAVISGKRVIYTPNPAFVGTNVFKYRVEDGRGGRRIATVTVRVKAPSASTAPVAKADAAEVPETDAPASSVPATGSASLSWSVPTTRANGEPLSVGELGGFEIYVLSESTGQRDVITVADPLASRYTVEGLAPGAYHFSIVARDSEGRLSDLSEVVTKTIGN